MIQPLFQCHECAEEVSVLGRDLAGRLHPGHACDESFHERLAIGRHMEKMDACRQEIAERECGVMTCPQCGIACVYLHEGYCRDCRDDRQATLDMYNAQHDRWRRLSPEEREREIRDATRGPA